MNPTRNRFLIFVRDLIRAPYNAMGMWLLRQRLARLGHRPASVTAPPPIGRAQRAANARLIPIFPTARVPQPAARTPPGARQPWVLHRYDNGYCPAAFVVGLPHGQYHAPLHDIFDAHGGLLPELSFYGPENRLAESREYAQRYAGGLPPAADWPGVTAALASHHAETNYFHWMLQVLPRFELLRLAGISHAKVDRYLLNEARFPFHTETLAAFGVPLDKVCAAGPQTHIRAEYLWAAASLRLSAHLNGWVADFLRRQFLPAGAPPSGSERLFIGRADATVRRLVNEPELAHRLERLGFRTMVPGQLSVAEQARLLAGAKVVVGPHGAGLANLVFAQPGTKVLELHSPGRRAMYYWEMSNARGLDYSYLIGEDARSAADEQAFRVPLARLEALLDFAGVR